MAKVCADSICKIELLRALSPEVRDCLLSRARTRDVKRGETLSWQGDRAETLKIVTRGWVKLFRVSEEGHEAVVNTLGQGQSFDEVPALLGGESTVSAEAITEATVLLLNLTDICSCTNARAELSRAVLSAAQIHMNSMTNQIEGLKVKTATQRLGEFLLQQSGEHDGLRSFVLPFGKVVLAGMLGMKPESLSRAFSRLKDVGVCSAGGKVEINDPATLRDWMLQQSIR